MANTTVTINKESDGFKAAFRRSSEKYGSTPNAIINRDLERYYELLKNGRKIVRKIFTQDELQLLVDICNGTVFEPIGMILSSNGLLLQFQDSIEDGYCEKWNVEEDKMTVKLSDLDASAQMALIDALEIFWANANKYSSLLECLKDLK